jgi:type IV pilus assembly protein PilB
MFEGGVTGIDTKKKKIGDLLIENKIITAEQLEEASNIQKMTGKKLSNVLIENNYVTETQIMEVLEFQLGIPFIDLNKITIKPEVLRLIPYQLIKRHNVIPVKLELNLLYVAMEDPLNFIAIDDIRMATNYEIVPVISFRNTIIRAINKLYGNETSDKAIKEFQKESDLNNTHTAVPE